MQLQLRYHSHRCSSAAWRDFVLGALTGRWLGDGINIQIQASLGVAELKRFPQLPARFQHVFLDAEHGMELEGRDGAAPRI
ncbi:Protein of unknown function [Pyronema omphalodes CBS 100304]|uniref:Uncharacterized protein n=1 Tax=Pyronema omphalodes (strain CBS 100304) TaxID=1076935 RepID=U4L7U4_PYROM|nr:Protein of unknown function [Pyronema omphalodes CBS 100304]